MVVVHHWLVSVLLSSLLVIFVAKVRDFSSPSVPFTGRSYEPRGIKPDTAPAVIPGARLHGLGLDTP